MKNPFKIIIRHSKILDKIFYGIDCKNGCYVEYDNIADAKDKIKQLQERLINNNGEFK